MGRADAQLGIVAGRTDRPHGNDERTLLGSSGRICCIGNCLEHRHVRKGAGGTARRPGYWRCSCANATAEKGGEAGRFLLRAGMQRRQRRLLHAEAQLPPPRQYEMFRRDSHPARRLAQPRIVHEGQLAIAQKSGDTCRALRDMLRHDAVAGSGFVRERNCELADARVRCAFYG